MSIHRLTAVRSSARSAAYAVHTLYNWEGLVHIPRRQRLTTTIYGAIGHCVPDQLRAQLVYPELSGYGPCPHPLPIRREKGNSYRCTLCHLITHKKSPQCLYQSTSPIIRALEGFLAHWCHFLFFCSSQMLVTLAFSDKFCSLCRLVYFYSNPFSFSLNLFSR